MANGEIGPTMVALTVTFSGNEYLDEARGWKVGRGWSALYDPRYQFYFQIHSAYNLETWFLVGRISSLVSAFRLQIRYLDE